MQEVIQAISSVFRPVMAWLYQWCGDFGLAIILFTFLTKFITLPLSILVHLNGLKVIRIQPQLNLLKVAHYGDVDAIAEGQTALYKKEKYHPLLSLVPILFQLLILMGMVDIIRNPGFEVSNMVFLGFLDLRWVANGMSWKYLGIPVACGLSALLMSLVQNRLNPLQKEQNAGMQWGTLIFSVGLSLYLGYFVQAGIALYWITSNLLAIVQQILLNKAIPPEKYIDYEALQESRDKLEELESLDDKALDKKVAAANKKRERNDEKRFFSVSGKHLVFYSESQGFYKYFSPVIKEIIARSNLTIHYITSDPEDRIFEIAKENERIRPYYIGPKRLITVFMKMDADVVVMTMSDLDNYHYKRSYVRKDIHYIYMFHYPLSTHMVLHTGALDHYDEILCVGGFQIPEIRAAEKMRNLVPKTLKICGYCQLDELYHAFQETKKKSSQTTKILIAPSWQEGNILDSCIDGILDALTANGWEIIVRPHPEYMKRYAARMDSVISRWKQREVSQLSFETDFTSNASIYGSDIVITDWSGTATEFSFITLRPCIFIDTPPKVNNPDYEKLGIEPQELRLRKEIGKRIHPNSVENIAEIVKSLLNEKTEWEEKIYTIREELIANFPDSAKVSAREILRTVVEQQYKQEEELQTGAKNEM